MGASGWKQLLEDAPQFRGEGKFPIAAYSEFMPPPRLALKPYGSTDGTVFAEDDPWGWRITEYEEARELRPGLTQVARQLLSAVAHLGRGEAAHGIAKNKLADNPYWPPELAERAGSLTHERYVLLSALALSRTQDDKGRVRWTLFGGSEHGPARPFWQGFFTAPGREPPSERALAFLRQLLHSAYGEALCDLADLHALGFRILPQKDPVLPCWTEEPLPEWTKPYLLRTGSLQGVRYLLTFRPFARLPAAVKNAYLARKLHLLPFPGSLVFWGASQTFQLGRELPLAMQIPLLHSVMRHESPFGIRVPQSGWLYEPRAGRAGPGDRHGPFRHTYRRTNRWARVQRDEDELAIESREERVAHVLFSASPDDLGLYGKPMARNAQLWTEDYHALLNGPWASPSDIHRAMHAVAEGGLFGYRFQYPAMRVGAHEVYWHRPLVAYLCPQTGEPTVLRSGPLGYLTAYPADAPDPARPIVLWPRVLDRPYHVEAVSLFEHVHDPRPYQTSRNIRRLLEARDFFGPGAIPRDFARQMMNLPRQQSLDDWLVTVELRASPPELGRRLAEEMQTWLADSSVQVGPGKRRRPQASLTFERTARRSFEVSYWKTIAHLAEGKYINKDNADCVRDATTQSLLKHHHRDLEALGDYLLAYYRRQVQAARMTGKALAGELPFRWTTDFNFDWSGGWLQNQEGSTHERDIVLVIPGRDRRRAVIMADHYDTAYMEDHYDGRLPKKGARLAASGADDNHSATAALMLGAPIFMELSRAGKLACDVWLVHLTGEEFPADCLGARHLCERLVEGALKLRLTNGEDQNLSRVRVQGVYVLDMVAHNNDRAPDIFQIAPGTGRPSFWLAYQAHLAAESWNAWAEVWNRRPSRSRLGRGRRSPNGKKIPEPAKHPHLSGEVRLPYDPRSTLYNTDGQIFSDAGVPVVLFMENYDISRSGYHDSHDTMENIDLDYGAAVASIAIESVARAATENPDVALRVAKRK
jgi:Peptidase family M28